MPRKAKILVFVEDPGPAAYAALLLSVFERCNWGVVLCASGVAAKYLLKNGIEFIDAPPPEESADLLSRISPNCLLTGTAENPDTLGLRLIVEARSANIPSVAFIDACMNSAYRFRGTTSDPLAYVADWLLVPDDWALRSFVDLGLSSERIVVCGHPQYDNIRARAKEWELAGGVSTMRQRIFPSVPKDQRIITFISEGEHRFNLLPKATFARFGFQGRGVDKGRTKIILEEVLDVVKECSRRPYVVFRAHPTEQTDGYIQYGAEINYFSSDESPLELIYASDLVVGMTSILLLEAALLGRPTLAVLTQPSEVALLPNVRNGLTPHALTRHDLRKLLPSLLDANLVCAIRSMGDMLVADAARRVTGALFGII